MSKVLSALFILSLAAGRNAALAQDSAASPGAPPKELVQYVRDAKKAGLNEQQIQQNAVGAGWPAVAVTDAIASVATAPKSQPNAAADKKAVNPPAGQFIAPRGLPANPVLVPEGAPKPKNTDATPAAGPVGQPTAVLPGVQSNAVAPGVGVDSSVKPAQPVSRGVPDDYQIGAGDVLHVSVWGEPTASINGAVVRTDGKISLPLIHDIYVMGMTPAQAEKTIGDQLGRFLNSPDVAVIIGGINSKKIYITGQLKKEGTIAYTYRMTVMQAISEAGGLTPYAKRKKIYVLRHEDGREFRLPFDYDAVLRGEHMEMNIPLKPGDQLIVP